MEKNEQGVYIFHSVNSIEVMGRGLIKLVDSLKGCEISRVKELCGKKAVIDCKVYIITGVEFSSGFSGTKVNGLVSLLVKPAVEMVVDESWITKKRTLREIRSMPIIRTSQYDDVLFENEKYRMWLSNMTVDDGAPYNDQVTVEEYIDGKWVIIMQYEPALEIEPYPDPVYIRELLIEVESVAGCPFRFCNSANYNVCTILYDQSLNRPVYAIQCVGVADDNCPLHENEKVIVQRTK